MSHSAWLDPNKRTQLHVSYLPSGFITLLLLVNLILRLSSSNQHCRCCRVVAASVQCRYSRAGNRMWSRTRCRRDDCVLSERQSVEAANSLDTTSTRSTTVCTSRTCRHWTSTCPTTTDVWRRWTVCTVTAWRRGGDVEDGKRRLVLLVWDSRHQRRPRTADVFDCSLLLLLLPRWRVMCRTTPCRSHSSSLHESSHQHYSNEHRPTCNTSTIMSQHTPLALHIYITMTGFAFQTPGPITSSPSCPNLRLLRYPLLKFQNFQE